MSSISMPTTPPPSSEQYSRDKSLAKATQGYGATVPHQQGEQYRPLFQQPVLEIAQAHTVYAWFEFVLNEKKFVDYLESLNQCSGTQTDMACDAALQLINQFLEQADLLAEEESFNKRYYHIISLAAQVVVVLKLPLEMLEKAIPLRLQRVLMEGMLDIDFKNTAMKINSTSLEAQTLRARWIIRSLTKQHQITSVPNVFYSSAKEASDSIEIYRSILVDLPPVQEIIEELLRFRNAVEIVDLVEKRRVLVDIANYYFARQCYQEAIKYLNDAKSIPFHVSTILSNDVLNDYIRACENAIDHIADMTPVQQLESSLKNRNLEEVMEFLMIDTLLGKRSQLSFGIRKSIQNRIWRVIQKESVVDYAGYKRIVVVNGLYKVVNSTSVSLAEEGFLDIINLSRWVSSDEETTKMLIDFCQNCREKHVARHEPYFTKRIQYLDAILVACIHESSSPQEFHNRQSQTQPQRHQDLFKEAPFVSHLTCGNLSSETIEKDLLGGVKELWHSHSSLEEVLEMTSFLLARGAIKDVSKLLSILEKESKGREIAPVVHAADALITSSSISFCSQSNSISVSKTLLAFRDFISAMSGLTIKWNLLHHLDEGCLAHLLNVCAGVLYRLFLEQSNTRHVQFDISLYGDISLIIASGVDKDKEIELMETTKESLLSSSGLCSLQDQIVTVFHTCIDQLCLRYASSSHWYIVRADLLMNPISLKTSIVKREIQQALSDYLTSCSLWSNFFMDPCFLQYIPKDVPRNVLVRMIICLIDMKYALAAAVLCQCFPESEYYQMGLRLLQIDHKDPSNERLFQYFWELPYLEVLLHAQASMKPASNTRVAMLTAMLSSPELNQFNLQSMRVQMQGRLLQNFFRWLCKMHMCPLPSHSWHIFL